MTNTNRVLINGASIAGLTAAARLSKAKYQCFISGASYQNTIIDGFEFDNGALLTLPATFRDFFQKTGKHFGQVLEVKPCDPAFVYKFKNSPDSRDSRDLVLNFSNLSHSARANEIEQKLGPAAAKEWDRLIATGEYFWDQLRENYIEWEFDLLRSKLGTYLKLKPPFIENPYLRKIVGHYATYFGYPAGIYKWSQLVAFAEESFGIWQITGGLGALNEALITRCKELGVTFDTTTDYQYRIDAFETFNRPAQRLIGIQNYPDELPVRTVIFHADGLTTDIYASYQKSGSYALVLTGALDIHDFDKYAVVDRIRPAQLGSADNRLITRIRTANKRVLRAKHLDSLAHAAITGELLANAVRGIKNRPSHEH